MGRLEGRPREDAVPEGEPTAGRAGGVESGFGHEIE